jgi:fructokinase
MKQHNHSITCYGEILWDLFPSGAKPGGAPMNVAYHLRKLGQQPKLITRIGADKFGSDLVDIMVKADLCTDYIQTDENYSTGLVKVLANEQSDVVYDIVQPAAWDNIISNRKNIELVGHSDYFIYGSLSARSLQSRDTLFKLLHVARSKVFDINLRAPHYDQFTVKYLISQAGIFKLNIHELELVASWFGHYRTHAERIEALHAHFKTPLIVVTMGSQGAMLYKEGKLYHHPGFAVEVADTVGSGDAFLAGLLHQLIQGASNESALAFACAMGSLIATKKGGCPDYQLTEIDSILHTKSLSDY